MPTPERQRAAAAAFADADDDHGHGEARHLAEVAGDGFGLAALLGVDAGIGAGGVEEGDDRAAELAGDLHGAEGLAIALGLGHAEVAEELLFGVAALLLADEHDGAAFELRHAGDDGGIVGEGAVAVDLLEIGQQALDVVEGVRALGVAGELNSTPRRMGFGHRRHGIHVHFRIHPAILTGLQQYKAVRGRS